MSEWKPSPAPCDDPDFHKPLWEQPGGDWAAAALVMGCGWLLWRVGTKLIANAKDVPRRTVDRVIKEEISKEIVKADIDWSQLIIMK